MQPLETLVDIREFPAGLSLLHMCVSLQRMSSRSPASNVHLLAGLHAFSEKHQQMLLNSAVYFLYI